MNPFWIAAAAGGVGGAWMFVSKFSDQIRKFFLRFMNVFVVQAHVNGLVSVRALMKYLKKHYPLSRSPFSADNYFTSEIYVKPLERKRNVLFRGSLARYQTFWLGRLRPLWFNAGVIDGAGSYSFSYFRGTVKFADLLARALDEYEDERWEGEGRFAIVRMGKPSPSPDTPGTPAQKSGSDGTENIGSAEPIGQWKMEDLGYEASPRAAEDMALTEEMKDVLDEVRFWHTEESWYREHRVPWWLALLFKGEPGTGKTSLARVIAEEEDLPLFQVDLSTLDDEAFVYAVKEIASEAPAVILLEDFDRVYEGDKNIDPVRGPQFGTVLNTMNGVESYDGILWIVTTNHPETLDPALCRCDDKTNDDIKTEENMPSRPGRVDRIVDFPRLNDEGRQKIAKRILDDDPSIPDVIEKGKNDTGAQFQLRCFRVARNHRFKRRTR